MYRKNTASQVLAFQGVDATTGGIKSGVTWTIRRCIDGTFAAATGTVTEDSTNGWYKFAMSQADTNGNNIQFNFTGTGAVPQTVNILTDGSPPDVNLKNAAGTAVTLDANNVLNVSTKYLGGTLQTARDIGASVLLSTGTGTGQLDFTSGVVKANAVQWLGTACSTPTVAGVPNVNCKTWNDLATVALPLVPTTAGRTLDVSAGGEAGVDWANVGTPGSTVNLSATTVNLCNTITTYTGNTVQTGDAYSRIGAAGAGLTALGDTRIANLDATVSSRLATSGYTAPPTAAQNATAVFTTQLTESYAALHVVPTLAQCLFELRALQAEKSVAGTVLTTKKYDGSTTARTYALSDATAPTSITAT